VISEANRAKLVFPPGVKLWAHAYGVAGEVCKLAPTGTHVLASRAVLQQLPTIHGCGHPLIADPRWMTASDEDEQARLQLAQYVGDAGDIPLDRSRSFLDALSHYDVDVVVVSKAAQPNTRTKSLVRMAGFEKAATVSWEQVYVRTTAATRQKYAQLAELSCKSLRGGKQSALLAPFGVAAAVHQLGCARSIAAPAWLRSAPDDELDTALRLERLTYMEADARDDEVAWIAAEIDRRGTEIVVLNAPALANKRFKSVLRELGFRAAKSMHGHTIARRTLPE
jgi:hypothetical protein